MRCKCLMPWKEGPLSEVCPHSQAWVLQRLVWASLLSVCPRTRAVVWDLSPLTGLSPAEAGVSPPPECVPADKGPCLRLVSIHRPESCRGCVSLPLSVCLRTRACSQDICSQFAMCYIQELRICAQLLSHVQLFATPWTVACQAPLPMEFSRQEYWSGLPFPTPRDLPDPRIKLISFVSSALAGGFFTTVPPGKPQSLRINI